MSTQQTIILDIETIGEDYDSLDKATQESLTRWIKKKKKKKKKKMDYHKNEGVVYFQSPGVKYEETREDGILFKAMEEKEMLEKFWEVARKCQVFVTFNGRSFDMPFLFIRSAIHGIRPSKDLMRGRYLYQNNPEALHIDLLEQLTFYGAVRRKGSLHLWARAFGIESPKAAGVTGDDVGPLFKKKKFLEIARYNVGDLRATRALYEKWKTLLSF